MQLVNAKPDAVACRPIPLRGAKVKHLAWAGALSSTFPAAYLARPLLLRDLLPVCPFRCATGRPCPFCGLSRALSEATHCHWHEAYAFHPLWPEAAAVLVLLTVLHLIDAYSNRQTCEALLRNSRSRWIWAAAGLAAFAVWRSIWLPL